MQATQAKSQEKSIDDFRKAKKVTTHTLQEMKQAGVKISMLTAYDYSMARIVDDAGIDVILVGDSASNVMAGHETTLPITLDQMIYHASSVVRGINRALVVVDLPFGSEKQTIHEITRTYTNQIQLIRERSTNVRYALEPLAKVTEPGQRP